MENMEPEIRIVEIGPAQARDFLHEDINVDNRKIDWKIVGTYAREMVEGNWKFAGDPIRISRTNRLLDGQYRLNAVVQSGKPQQFLLITGLPDDVQTVMDIGKKRTPADVFSMKGVSYAGTSAAIVGLVMRYDRANVLDTKFVVQPGELLAWYQQDNHDRLVDQAAVTCEQLKRMLPVSATVAGAVHVIASRESEAFAVNEFFEKLLEGYGLEPGNAIGAFRNWAIRRKREDLRTKRAEWFYVMLTAWNKWATDEYTDRMQLPRDGLASSDQIPKLVPVIARKPKPVTEDNPAVTHYSKTRKELEAAGRRKAS